MIDTLQNRKEFASAIEAAWLTVGQPAPNKPMLLMFWEVLKGYELDEIKAAVAKHLANPDSGHFAPKPADLVRMIEGDTATRVALAWGKVENAIRRVGPYDSLVFDDPMIHAVISDLGGWSDLCAVSEHELPHKGRDFSNRYRAYCSAPPATYPRVVAGITEAHAVSNSLPAPAPRLIGDKQKAAQVLALGGTTGTLQISGPKSVDAILKSAGASVRAILGPAAWQGSEID